MSGVPVGSELTQPRTRRQIMRAAIAGAALTLPLTRGVAPARAAGPHDCQKGCLYTSDRRWEARFAGCTDKALVATLVFLYSHPLDGALRSLDAWRCQDRTFLQHKASSFDCSKPGCPGFDPKSPNGPCDGCRDNCCTCQALPNGSICCIFDCADPDHQCCPGG